MTNIDERFPIGGIHHVTEITSNAQRIYDFFTNILGLRLAKLTVNQDDYQTYHLYFTDEDGNAGTDITFFDFPGLPQGQHGNYSIDRSSFRVPTDASLSYWAQRFDEAQVAHGPINERFGKRFMNFVDFDNQQYALISDEQNEGVAGGIPWEKSNVAKEHAIIGLGPTFIKLPAVENVKGILEEVLGFKYLGTDGSFHRFEVGAGGNGATVIVEESDDKQFALQAYGSIHHMALRVADPEALHYWVERINAYRFRHSGLVDRYYFSSEYFQIAPGVLFEIATDTPGVGALQDVQAGLAKIDNYEQALITSGFWIDETKDEAGTDLSLPPHLFPAGEAAKAKAAAILRPLDTSDANRDRSDDPLWTMADVLKER